MFLAERFNILCNKIKNKRLKGASLLELLVAMVIFALALSQALLMEVAGYKFIEMSYRTELATDLAKSTIASYRGIGAEGIEATTSPIVDTVRVSGKTFIRIIQITPLSTSSIAKRITVTIEWYQGGTGAYNKKTITLTGVVR